MKTPPKMHLEKRGCVAARGNVPTTLKLTKVTCCNCLQALLYQRVYSWEWDTYQQHEGEVEYAARNTMITEMLERLRRVVSQGPLKSKYELATFCRRTPYEYLPFPRHRSSVPYEDVELAPEILEEADHWNAGTSVDCDEWVESMRLQLGRNLEKPTSWFLNGMLFDDGSHAEFWCP
jgi:hypothetical protein